MKKLKKSSWGFGVVKKVKLGGKWTTVIASERHLSKEDALEQMRELQRKMHIKNGNGR